MTEDDENRLLQSELDALEAAAPLSARETSRYLEIELRLFRLQAEARIKRARELLEEDGPRGLHPRVASHTGAGVVRF